MRLTYVCSECGAKARRSGSVGDVRRDVRCPNGHGQMVREDGTGRPIYYTPSSASIGLKNSRQRIR